MSRLTSPPQVSLAHRPFSHGAVPAGQLQANPDAALPAQTLSGLQQTPLPQTGRLSEQVGGPTGGVVAVGGRSLARFFVRFLRFVPPFLPLALVSAWLTRATDPLTTSPTTSRANP
jgi:hypothetical protein